MSRKQEAQQSYNLPKVCTEQGTTILLGKKQANVIILMTKQRKRKMLKLLWKMKVVKGVRMEERGSFLFATMQLQSGSQPLKVNETLFSENSLEVSYKI